MRKFLRTFLLIGLVCLTMTLTACEDRSYTINKVTISAEIDESGRIHVQEVYTYSFDGEYNGTTRTIKSDVSNFNAFLLPDNDHRAFLEGDTKKIKPLQTELDKRTYKSFTKSNNETKTILYTYEINGSVEKYRDIGKLYYSFFDKENESDIRDLTITILLPTSLNIDDMYVFLREKGDSGSVEKYTNTIVYKNDLLPAKKDSYLTLLFPSSALSEMEVTEDKDMLNQTLAAEEDWQDRATHLQENFSTLKPIIMILAIMIVLITVFIIRIHPIRNRKKYDDETLIQIFERTDPLFVSYLERFRLIIDEKSLLPALFSLKTREIIHIEEAPSNKDENKSTVRFTWMDHHKEIDEADQYLKDWLFTETTENEVSFLLEDIIDDVKEPDDVRKIKAKAFNEHVQTWKNLVLEREEYEQVRYPYPLFKWIAMLFAVICGGLFYYFITIDILSRGEQISLKLIIIVSTLLVTIFSRHKFVLFLYYGIITTLSLIFFSLFSAGIWAIVLYVIAFIASLCIPAYYWTEEVAPIKQSMNKASNLIIQNQYPVGSDVTIIENRILYAINLNLGKKYAKQFNKEQFAQELKESSNLLLSAGFIVESFTHNAIFYSLTRINSGGGSSGGSSSSGGGGAGAF